SAGHCEVRQGSAERARAPRAGRAASGPQGLRRIMRCLLAASPPPALIRGRDSKMRKIDATCAHGRSKLGSPRLPERGKTSSGRAEDGEVVLAEFVGGVDPAELQRHAVAEVAGLEVDGIGDEERAFG